MFQTAAKAGLAEDAATVSTAAGATGLWCSCVSVPLRNRGLRDTAASEVGWAPVV